MKKTKITSEQMEAFNNCRTAQMLKEKPFSRATFIEIWKSCKLPRYASIITSCIQLNIIKRVARDQYKFCELSTPYCHISRVENAIELMRAISYKHIANKAANKKIKEIAEKVEKPCENTEETTLNSVADYLKEEIEKAIKLLKNNGYKVFKPETITIYKEV